MPRHSILRPELELHQRALAAMIDDALKAGQRSDGDDPKYWTPWTNRALADKACVAENSVANWRDPDRRMPPEDIKPLLKVFYGKIERLAEDRARMERLWRLARGYIIDDEPEQKKWEIAKKWEVAWTANLQGMVRLVDLRAHPPIPGNDGTMRLSLTLVITPDHDVTYRDQAVIIGLTDALLCMDSNGWQAARRSFVSERGHPNFELSAAGARIVGPRDAATGMINGEPMGDDDLAVVEPIGAGDAPINVAVHAPRGSFRVLVRAGKSIQGAPADRVSRTQNLVLNALLHEQLRDRDDRDRAVLARVTVQPRST